MNAREVIRGPPSRSSSGAATQAKQAPSAIPIHGAKTTGTARCRQNRAMLRSHANAMEPGRLRNLLEAVHQGKTTIDAAVAELRDLPFADIGYAAVDHHRALRQGAPEVILGAGKTSEQIVGIARELERSG